MPIHTTGESMNNYVPDNLRLCAKTYEERNKIYGDCYKVQGRIMKEIFPDGIPMLDPNDFNRAGIVFKIIDKVIRYSANFSEGGHKDSLHDISVYCIMLMELDEKGI